MEQPLFLKIIDYIDLYGLQVIGIILIIFLSKFFIQAILLVISAVVFILMGIFKILLNVVHFLLTLIAGKKLNKVIFKIESILRGMGENNDRIKEWFKDAPAKYVTIHKYITNGIKSVITLAVILSIVIFIYNVFIEKSLSIEQIVYHIDQVRAQK